MTVQAVTRRRVLQGVALSAPMVSMLTACTASPPKISIVGRAFDESGQPFESDSDRQYLAVFCPRLPTGSPLILDCWTSSAKNWLENPHSPIGRDGAFEIRYPVGWVSPNTLIRVAELGVLHRTLESTQRDFDEFYSMDWWLRVPEEPEPKTPPRIDTGDHTIRALNAMGERVSSLICTRDPETGYVK